MLFALRTLWFERRRYLPGVMAVAFSGLLVALQVGIFWGLIGVVSLPIVESAADIWVAYPNTRSIDLGRAMPAYWADRLWMLGEIERADQYIQGMALWKTDEEQTELTIVSGSNLEDDTLGPARRLSAEQRNLLREPGAVILDLADRHRLDIREVGQAGAVNGHPVRVVGFMQGMSSLTGPFAICSLATARTLLNLREDQTTFLLAKCKSPEDVPVAVEKLREFKLYSVHEAKKFALDSKIHWLTKTKAGVAVTFVALLGLLVGAVVTSQTLYAATAASVRELAVLRALGIPNMRIRFYVLQTSFLVGLLGLLVGIPTSIVFALIARQVGTNAEMAPWILWGTASLTLAMAVVSGFFALRSLRLAEPTALLR
ncbi:MAG TPA: ABC transporter permease [Planctomycetia bacterium]|nr:ABC transporter permease [Planctomycetia bacterium]